MGGPISLPILFLPAFSAGGFKALILAVAGWREADQHVRERGHCLGAHLYLLAQTQIWPVSEGYGVDVVLIAIPHGPPSSH